MSISSVGALAAALDQPIIYQQSANPSSPDYVAPLPPQPGPAPARLPDIDYQASPNTALGVPDSATSQQLAAVRSAIMTIEPDSIAPLTTAPQPLQQPGPIQPKMLLTL